MDTGMVNHGPMIGAQAGKVCRVARPPHQGVPRHARLGRRRHRYGTTYLFAQHHIHTA
jgi:hypothetical protein